jgi:mannose-6-phosphate isomerase-like protein (cupin superfamily)
MYVITAAEAPRFELPGVHFTGQASPSRGSRDICTWRLTVAPGLVSPEHHTIDQDEVFMVISGQVRLTLDGPLLGPGDAAVVPAGHPIQLTNPGTEPASLVVAIASGFTAKMQTGITVDTPPWAV